MTTEQTNDRLVTDLKAGIGRAEEALEATAGHVGENANEIRRRLASVIASAKATCQHLEEKTLAAAKATDRTIRQHPYESMGVAFGLGLLVGVLVTRK